MKKSMINLSAMRLKPKKLVVEVATISEIKKKTQGIMRSWLHFTGKDYQITLMVCVQDLKFDLSDRVLNRALDKNNPPYYAFRQLLILAKLNSGLKHD